MDGMRNTQYRFIETHRIAGALGAEVTGVDLSQDLPDEVIAELRAALLEHLVIFFRNQDLTPARQLAFARRWGEIHLHPFMAGMPDHPEVLEIRKTPADKRNFGGSWHTDQMFAPQPAMGTMLYGVQVPSAGGDTLFSNQYLAYESLSDGMKKLVGGLRGVCVGDKKRGGVSRMAFNAATIAMKTVEPPKDMQTTTAHPLVRTHPETGRKSLYVGNHVHWLEGMTEEESAPLIRYLRDHSARPEFTCRFRWQNGSLAFWDNRCTQHNAINDYPAEIRVMHRVTICGDTPY
ncbi:MAG: TauD/TfdA dioxygenase family protein [Acetobacteraceae bacterium]